MLEKLYLKNFRGFFEHTLLFNPLTILVGRNNAGKSTIVEALRLISVVTSRYKSLKYFDVPEWLTIPKIMKGVRPSLKDLNINFKTIFYRYGEPPAEIHAFFNSNEKVIIYLGPSESIHAVILNSDGNPIRNKGQAVNVKLPKIGILPQIGPLKDEEKILDSEYVRSSMNSSLSSLHFRNQIRLFYKNFDNFKKLSESSWPGLQIKEFDGIHGLPGDNLSLFLRDGDFVSEVGLVGHGLQMWLQTMWFLSLVKESHTVILDEPDVYMHADLQRRLIRILKGKFKQVIIATHSIEIMAEVEPKDILIIDKSKKRSKFTTSLPAVQKIIDYIGGVHNIHLARIGSSKRIILVEGKDIQILKRIQNTLFPESKVPLDTIPYFSIGGWNGWSYVVGTSMFVHSTGIENIKFYCILDSDYHLPLEIEERYKEAKSKNIQLHIWGRKEIENYLIVPSAIARVINSRSKKTHSVVNPEIISSILEEIYNSSNFRNNIHDCIADEFLKQNRAFGLKKANERAREFIESVWGDEEKRQSIIPGKMVITELSKWSQKEFGISISAISIAHELKSDEIHVELKKVLTAIEKKSDFY